MASRLRFFAGRTEVQGIEPRAEIVLHLVDGLKLVVENNPAGVTLSVAGVHREQLIEVYDHEGSELCQIPVRAGVS